MTATLPPFLLVTPELPWPPDQGSRQFQLDVAQGLAQLSELRWVSRDTGGEAARRLARQGFELELDGSFRSRHPLRRLFRRAAIDLAAARARRPRELAFVSSPGVRRIAGRVAARDPRTIAVGAYWSTWPALLGVPRERRVLVVADVEHDVRARAAALGRLGGGGVGRMRDAELEAFAEAGLVLCLTAEDEAAVRAALRGAGLERAVGRWPVELAMPELAPPRPRDPQGGLRLFCYGHWQADFNRDGLEHFLAELWPAMRRHPLRPQLRVAGRGLDRLRQAPPEGVEFVGWVEDLPAALAGSDAVVVPLRYAGGLRYRLLEAMAHGRPVLCSEAAARGSGAIAGEHFLLARGPREWHDQLGAVAGAAGAALAKRARDFVREHYGATGRSERLRSELSRLPALRGSGLEDA